MYQPLDPTTKQFRVLKICRGRESLWGKRHLQCSLQTVSIESGPPPEYETVSYCWGDATQRATIEVSGLKLSVPASSEAALRRLRLPATDRVVWIDAICINQEDLRERSQQVSMMADIYRNSQGNLIYLGEDEGKLKGALKAVEVILEQARRETYEFRTLKSVLFDRGMSLRFHLAADDPLPRFDVQSLEWLFDRQWFRRMWVIQEATLAPKNTCYCGKQIFELVDIVRASCWVMLKRPSAPFPINMNTFAPLVHLFNLVDKDHGSWSLGDKGEYKWFGELLHKFAMRYQVTDPKDAIYGLLGLITPLTAAPPLIMDMIRPDYAKSLPDTLRDATRFALFESSELSLLRTVKHPRDDGELPEGQASWMVPAVQGSQDDLESPLNIKLLVRAFDSCHSRPLDRELLASPLNGDLGVLSLRGIIFDSVLTTSAVFRRKMFLPEGYQDLTRMLISVHDVLSTAIANSQDENDMPDTLGTLVAGSTKDSEPATAEDLQLQAEFLQHIAESKGEADAQTIQSWYRVADRQVRAMWRACKSRRLFITGTGFIGVGPRGMKSGDLITVLYGGPEPFVLRQNGDHYLFLGQAYVDKIMYGKGVWRHLQAGGTETVFHIR